MSAGVISLFEQLQNLPNAEQQEFLEMLQRWQGSAPVQSEETVRPRARPDFMARLREDFPHGVPPGKPVSELVDEGRGPRP